MYFLAICSHKQLPTPDEIVETAHWKATELQIPKIKMVAPSGDFKRIKAKVGKKAPVKANVTDTSFQSATLYVAKQSGVDPLSQQLSSSVSDGGATTTARGLSMPQLLLQLQHPAVAVRHSAVKGLGHYHKQHSGTNHYSSFLADVSQLVMALAPAACTDTDVTVRKTARVVLQELVSGFTVKMDSHHQQHPRQSLQSPSPQQSLQSSGTSSKSGRINSSSNSCFTNHNSKYILTPFAPFLMALVTTALNSLDVQQCYDGAVTVQWLAETSSSGCLDPSSLENALPQLLPALTRLLATAAALNTSNTTHHSTATTNSFSETSSFAAAAIPVGSMRKSKRNCITANRKKRKRSQQQSKNSNNNNNNNHSTSPKQAVLSAIRALFQATTTTTDAITTWAPSRPDVVVAGRGYRRPAIVFAAPNNSISRSRRTTMIRSLVDFPSWQQLGFDSFLWPETMDDGNTRETISSTSTAASRQTLGPMLTLNPTTVSHYSQVTTSSTTTGSSSPAAALDLITQLRDCLVEATPNQHNPQLFLTCTVTVRFVLESRWAFHTLWSSSSTTNATDSKRFLKLCSQVANCITESFPLQQQQQHDDANAELCQTLLCLALAITVQQQQHTIPVLVDAREVVRPWIQVVALHIQSALEDDEAALLMIDDDDAKKEEDGELPTVATPATTTKSLLRVLGQLFLQRKELLDDELRSSLLDLVGTVYFNPEKPLPSSTACSESVKAAALLGCQLLLLSDDDYGTESAHLSQAVMRDILYSLPRYLQHWRAEHLTETAACVTALQNVVRRSTDFGNDATSRYDVMAQQLRAALEPLLLTQSPTRMAEKKTSSVSIFEEYPEDLQRRIVCLWTMLSAPTTATVKGLGDVCARCHIHENNKSSATTTVSHAVASFITQCIHSVRKTIPMPVYVSFLIDSTGIMNLDRLGFLDTAEKVVTCAMALDQGLRNASSCLVDCGTAKVLPMLESLLTVLLTKVVADDSSNGVIRQSGSLQARAALSILALFSLDLTTRGGRNDSSYSVFDHLSESFPALVVDAVSRCMLSLPYEKIRATESAKSVTDFDSYWMQPIIALFASENALLCHTFGSAASSLDGHDQAMHIQILEAWLNVIQNPQLETRLKQDSNEMIARCKSTESVINDGPEERLMGRILAELELKSEQKW